MHCGGSWLLVAWASDLVFLPHRLGETFCLLSVGDESSGDLDDLAKELKEAGAVVTRQTLESVKSRAPKAIYVLGAEVDFHEDAVQHFISGTRGRQPKRRYVRTCVYMCVSLSLVHTIVGWVTRRHADGIGLFVASC
jgi:hypothetical protein